MDGEPKGSSAPAMTPEQFAMLPHDDLGPTISAIQWMLVVLSGSFLGLRAWCKIKGSRGLWWDDWILLASWVLLIIDVSLTSFLVSLGYGKHIWDFPPENIPKFLLPVNVRGTFAITVLAWTKTAFAVTLLRLTTGTTKAIVWFIIITVNITLGLSALLPWLQCAPLSAAWDFSVQGKCWDRYIIMNYNIFSGAYSAAMDFALALLPWQLLKTLQMKKKEKIGAGIAMSMGIFAGIAAVVKTIMLPKLYAEDIYDSVQLMIWDTVEGAITIVAASIPVLRVLIKEVRTTMRQTSGNKGNGTYGMGSRRHGTKIDNKLEEDELEDLGSQRNPRSMIGDSGSDKSILGASVPVVQGKDIVRMDRFEVSYETVKGKK